MNDQTQQTFLDKLVKKYIYLGMFKGSHFLLAPSSAMLFLDDLKAFDLPILGITTWIKVIMGDGSIGIAEDLINELSIHIDVLESETSVQDSITSAKTFVAQVANKIDYVSIDLDASLKWRITP